MSLKATVVMTIEVSTDSTWGLDCSIAQAHAQAVEEATGIVDSLLVDNVNANRRVRNVKVVSTNLVNLVLSNPAVPDAAKEVFRGQLASSLRSPECFRRGAPTRDCPGGQFAECQECARKSKETVDP